jgi:hypothetical protein
MLAKSIILWSVAAIAQARNIPRQVGNGTGAGSVVFDGRVKAAATAADFDTATGPFGKDFVKGQSKSFTITVSEFHYLPSFRFDIQSAGCIPEGGMFAFRRPGWRQGD